MKYTLVVALAVSAWCCGCGNVMVSGGLNQSTFAGTVSIVRLTLTNDGTQVTLVTLTEGMSAKDFTFCGNVVSQFPMHTTVQGSFTPGTKCSTVVRVTVSG